MNGLLEKLGDAHGLPSSQLTEVEENLLRKKLQIKTQALVMLSQELDQCRMQRDRYKLMAEQLQENLERKKELYDQKMINGYRNTTEYSTTKANKKEHKTNTVEEDAKLMDLLIEAREQNKCLRLQVDTLRQKFKEAQEDIKALRSKKAEDPKLTEDSLVLHQREEMLEQLEKLNIKCRQLKLDLQSVLDEKQELEMERDAFKCKAHRLNYELSQALSASKPVDIDALVNENRYLQERLQQLTEEKELTQQSVQKYKSMLDSKRQKGSIKLGGKSSVGSVMTFKQVEQLLQQGPNLPPQKAADALSELHSICTALLESLNDKNIALLHQKKTNKVLATRLCELDKAVQSPTMTLLEGYSSSDVDIKGDTPSLTSEVSEERSDDKESDLPHDVSLTEKDDKCKQSDESIAEQSVQSKQDDECCPGKSVEDKDLRFEERNESYFKPFVYPESFSLEEFNFEESLKKSLPDHLRLMVLKHLDELTAKENTKQ